MCTFLFQSMHRKRCRCCISQLMRIQWQVAALQRDESMLQSIPSSSGDSRQQTPASTETRTHLLSNRHAVDCTLPHKLQLAQLTESPSQPAGPCVHLNVAERISLPAKSCESRG